MYNFLHLQYTQSYMYAYCTRTRYTHIHTHASYTHIHTNTHTHIHEHTHVHSCTHTLKLNAHKCTHSKWPLIPHLRRSFSPIANPLLRGDIFPLLTSTLDTRTSYSSPSNTSCSVTVLLSPNTHFMEFRFSHVSDTH